MKLQVTRHLLRLGMVLIMSSAPAYCVGIVKVTNVTKDYIFAAIVRTEFGLSKMSTRFMNMYIDTEDPMYSAPSPKENYIQSLTVLVIPPGKTADIASHSWNALNYDRNLWVTWESKTLAQAMLTGRRTVMSQVAHFNIGSSTAPRYIGGRIGKAPAIFTKQTEAEHASGITLAQLRQIDTDDAEPRSLLEMRSYQKRALTFLGELSAKAQQGFQAAKQGVKQVTDDIAEADRKREQQLQAQQRAARQEKTAAIAGKYR